MEIFIDDIDYDYFIYGFYKLKFRSRIL